MQAMIPPYLNYVHAFIARIDDVAKAKDFDLVRMNLALCLRGIALKWYTSESMEGEQRLSTYENELTKSTTLLLIRSKSFRSIGMGTILKQKYDIHDAV